MYAVTVITKLSSEVAHLFHFLEFPQDTNETFAFPWNYWVQLNFRPMVIPLAASQQLTFAHHDPIKPEKPKKRVMTSVDSVLRLYLHFRKGTAGPIWKSVLNVGFGKKRVNICMVHHLIFISE